MKRVGTVVLAVAMLTPAVAQAQSRPSNTMHTNSAALYLDRAKKTRVEGEKQENLQKALEMALQGIQAKSNNPRAYLLAGQAYVQLGDAVRADSMFDKAEELWPEYKEETAVEREAMWVKSYNNGVLAMRDQKVDEAIAYFAAANEVFAGRPLAAVSLAQLYQQKGDAAKAIEAYRDALSIVQAAPRDKLSPGTRRSTRRGSRKSRSGWRR
jgi:tetratricopeptide (TPR) repeat protein